MRLTLWALSLFSFILSHAVTEISGRARSVATKNKGQQAIALLAQGGLLARTVTPGQLVVA